MLATFTSEEHLEDLLVLFNLLLEQLQTLVSALHDAGNEGPTVLNLLK